MSSRHRCFIKVEDVFRSIERAKARLTEKLRYGSRDLDDVANVIAKYMSDLQRVAKCFGCPLSGCVCPRLALLEISRAIIRKGASDTYITRSFVNAMDREFSSKCRCVAKPSFRGHELLSSYAIYTLVHYVLRKIGLDASSREKLEILISLAILFHHYASRDLETAINRFAQSDMPVIIVESDWFGYSREIIEGIFTYLSKRPSYESKIVELAEEAILEKLKALSKGTLRHYIYVSTFIDMLTPQHFKHIAKLYVIPLEPLCLADSFSSYLGRGVGLPPSIVRELLAT